MQTRLDVTFPSDDSYCAAWLYLPESDEPAPIIVLGHGLGSVREMRLDVYAEHFVSAGYACLVFDYRHFGASGGEPRQLLSVSRELDDWRSAVAFARSREEVDNDRIVLWGTSFGGGHVITTAAADRRIAAVIAQCPFTDGPASALAMHPWTSAKVTALALTDIIGDRLGREPVMVPSAGAPRSTALMATHDSESGYLGLVPPSSTFRNEVAARFALDISRYRPGRRTPEINCPILFCICEHDTVAPSAATQRHAARAPRGEIRLYDEGHFDIYVEPAFDQVIADQIAFLAAHVPATR